MRACRAFVVAIVAPIFELFSIHATAEIPTQTDHSVGVTTYRMKRGDTLFVLWQNYFTGPGALRRVKQINHITNVRRIPTGKVLIIPRSFLRDEKTPARLESFEGAVTIRAGGIAHKATAGDALGEGAEIETGRNAFVTLRLADGSALAVPSQSLLRLVWLRKVILTGAVEREVEVRAGRLRAKVTPMVDPHSNFRVITPVSVSAVRGTEFRVTYQAVPQFAASQVDSGTVSVAASGSEVLVTPGFGAAVKGGHATGVVSLLQSPKLNWPEKVQSTETLHFSLTSVAGAQKYHVQIAHDAGFLEEITEDTGGPDFELPSLPYGDYFVKVSAIDQVGLEGLSETYSFARWRNSIQGSFEIGAGRSRPLRFRWNGTTDGTPQYRFQLLREGSVPATIIDELGLTDSVLTVSDLPAGDYVWRVGSYLITKGGVIASWTEPKKFHLAK